MNTPRKPLILGIAGTELSLAEAALFAQYQPAGFILFARNIETPAQVKRLTAALRNCVQDKAVPILVDQEGGRVNRFQDASCWPQFPAAAHFGTLAAQQGLPAAAAACRKNYAAIGQMLADIGITINCAPCLDLPQPHSDAVIGDRAFSADPETALALGRAALRGLHEAGVAGCLKHMPGHGRAQVDSHKSLPVVTARRATLLAHDAKPFRKLAAEADWGMTAHIRYNALDKDAPATQSRRILQEIVRGHIGFQGVLVSDDLSMQALSGTIVTRAQAALDAGCDLVLHCNGDLREMQQLCAAIGDMPESGQRRLDQARTRLKQTKRPDDDTPRP